MFVENEPENMRHSHLWSSSPFWHWLHSHSSRPRRLKGLWYQCVFTVLYHHLHLCGKVLGGVEGRIVIYPLQISHIPEDQNTCHKPASDGARGAPRTHTCLVCSWKHTRLCEKTATPSSCCRTLYFRNFHRKAPVQSLLEHNSYDLDNILFTCVSQMGSSTNK